MPDGRGAEHRRLLHRLLALDRRGRLPGRPPGARELVVRRLHPAKRRSRNGKRQSQYGAVLRRLRRGTLARGFECPTPARGGARPGAPGLRDGDRDAGGIRTRTRLRDRPADRRRPRRGAAGAHGARDRIRLRRRGSGAPPARRPHPGGASRRLGCAHRRRARRAGLPVRRPGDPARRSVRIDGAGDGDPARRVVHRAAVRRARSRPDARTHPPDAGQQGRSTADPVEPAGALAARLATHAGRDGRLLRPRLRPRTDDGTGPRDAGRPPGSRRARRIAPTKRCWRANCVFAASWNRRPMRS